MTPSLILPLEVLLAADPIEFKDSWLPAIVPPPPLGLPVVLAMPTPALICSILCTGAKSPNSGAQAKYLQRKHDIKFDIKLTQILTKQNTV